MKTKIKITGFDGKTIVKEAEVRSKDHFLAQLKYKKHKFENKKFKKPKYKIDYTEEH